MTDRRSVTKNKMQVWPKRVRIGLIDLFDFENVREPYIEACLCMAYYLSRAFVRFGLLGIIFLSSGESSTGHCL